MILTWGICNYLEGLSDDIVTNSKLGSTEIIKGINTPKPLYTPSLPQVPQANRLDIYIENFNTTENANTNGLISVDFPLLTMMPFASKSSSSYFPILETATAYLTKVICQLALYNTELLATYEGKGYEETWKTYIQQVNNWRNERAWGSVPVSDGGAQDSVGWIRTTFNVTITQAFIG
jgi:hypothetical protein